MVNQVAFRETLARVRESGASLVAVSKFKKIEDIQDLYDAGQRDFGENYVQELVEKQARLPADIRWHFIGHLQSNKVKYIAPFVHLIQSVDSFRLLKEINRQAERQGRNISCLLQMHVAEEETKFGIDEKELVEFMDFYEAQKGSLNHVAICGLMGMASFTEDRQQLEQEFRQLKRLFEFTRSSYFLGDSRFSILSMGMSNDYQLALDAGSNMVRIGSLLFGNRSQPV